MGLSGDNKYILTNILIKFIIASNAPSNYSSLIGYRHRWSLAIDLLIRTLSVGH